MYAALGAIGAGWILGLDPHVEQLRFVQKRQLLKCLLD
jgi:hypothetical protein